MTMQCCQQKAHCQCFQMWAAQYNGTAIRTVRCGYCRTLFLDKELCYLCLQNKNNGQDLNKTCCCQTTTHKDCTEILKETLARLTFEFSLECGELTFCGCISGTNFKKHYNYQNISTVNYCKNLMLINCFQIFIVVHHFEHFLTSGFP
jgi:hypothetical protein